MDQVVLIDLIKKFKKKGVSRGISLLLSPEDALALADEYRKIGMPIMGVTGWTKTASGKDLCKDDAVEYYVGDPIFNGADPVNESAAAVKDYLHNQLPKKTAYVSLDLDIEHWLAIFDQLVLD